MATYIRQSPIASGLNAASSFAGGFARTHLALRQMREVQNRWEAEFKLRKQMSQQNLELANRQYEFRNKVHKDTMNLQRENAEALQKRWKASFDQSKNQFEQTFGLQKKEYDFKQQQWEEGQNLRRLQTESAQLSLNNLKWKSDIAKTTHEETKAGTEHFFNIIPDILDMDPSEQANNFMQALVDTKRAFPNANTEGIEGLFDLIANSQIAKLGGRDLISTPQEVVDAKGQVYLQYMGKNGEIGPVLKKGVMSEDLKDFYAHWRTKISDKTKNIFTAFAEGRRLKLGGEINVAISDISDLGLNFDEVIGFVDQLSAYTQNEIASMRGQFEQELQQVVKDPEEREKITQSMFGEKSPLQTELTEKTAKKFMGDYERILTEQQGEHPTLDSWRFLAALYKQSLYESEGVERVLHKRALEALARKSLNYDEFNLFKDKMNQHAEEFVNELQMEEASRMEEQQREEAAMNEAIEDNRMDLVPSNRSLSPTFAPPPVPTIEDMRLQPSHERGSSRKREIPWWAVGVPRE